MEPEQNHAGRQMPSSGTQKEGDRVGLLRKLGRRSSFIHSKASYGPGPVWGSKTGGVISPEGLRGSGGQGDICVAHQRDGYIGLEVHGGGVEGCDGVGGRGRG